jgi:L-iditol 2-dehydrogenase
MARALGAEHITATDINEFRLKMAGSLGANTTIAATENVPARLREANDGRLADLVIVCSGAPQAIQQALETVERGGTLLFFAPAPEGVGVSIPLYEFWRNEVTLTTSYAGSPQDITKAIEMLRNHRLRVREMITHRIGLSEAGTGFQLVADARDSVKVIIEPQQH